jgi:hypothetical protein
MSTGFWWENLRQRDHWVDPVVDERIILLWVEGRDEHKFLMGKPEGKRPLGRPRLRWKDNIKMDGGQICAQGLR